MFGSEILEVAIAMVFIYLLLSLICSAVNELIERQLKNRAKDLECGLRELLNDPEGKDLVKKLYGHGMISGLFKGEYDPQGSKGNLPSYIPARNFAIALLNIIVPEGSGSGSLESIRKAVGDMQNAQVKTALAAMVDDAGNDLSKFRTNIEGWFNSSMDRISGWYKRRSQLIIFASGLLIALLLNVNSVTVANDLWLHKAQRDALVSAAQGYLNKHPGTELANGRDPGLQADVDNLGNYGLPTGWRSVPKFEWNLETVRFLTSSLLGWLITACAVSLGAPFWFDLLNKFIVVRSTVKPNEKSGEEPSKD